MYYSNKGKSIRKYQKIDFIVILLRELKMGIKIGDEKYRLKYS